MLFSRGNFLELVFVMQATKDSHRYNSTFLWNVVPMGLKRCLRRARIWRSRSEAGMWTSTIVMSRPCFERLSNLRLVERNDEIQTLSTHCSDQHFAKRV